MHATVHRYTTTGIALVGASVIAATPITVPQPDVHIRAANPAVQLTAFTEMVVPNALANAGLLAQAYLAEPFPIINAILGKEVTAPTDVFTASWWVGYSAVSWPIAPVGNVVTLVGAGLVGLAMGMPGMLFNTLLDIPGGIADGVLNGGFLPIFVGTPPFIPLPGLLTASFKPGPTPFPPPGIVGALIALDQAIGAAISAIFHPVPMPLAPANETPKPGATTLTLNTAPVVVDSGPTPGGRLVKPAADATATAQHEIGTATTEAADLTAGDQSGNVGVPAAVVEAPATTDIPATPAEPATPAIPATDDAPAIPATLEAPAAPEAPAFAEAPLNRGVVGNNKSDNGSRVKGHRGAA